MSFARLCVVAGSMYRMLLPADAARAMNVVLRCEGCDHQRSLNTIDRDFAIGPGSIDLINSKCATLISLYKAVLEKLTYIRLVGERKIGY